MIHLFIGQEHNAKESKIRSLTQELLPKEVADFNLDIVYGRELTLHALEERLLWIPVKSPSRLVIVKGAGDLKQELKDFLLQYVRSPQSKTVLVLDIEKYLSCEDFIKGLAPYAQIHRFKEEEHIDVFTLSRQLQARRLPASLKILSQLLKKGERPEQILGGLRVSLERNALGPRELKRHLKLLLNCDIDIKTGRLKPSFALEKFIISLCGSKYPSGKS